jgi:hypothetical protein
MKKLSNLTFAQQIVEICFSLTNGLQGSASGAAAYGCPGQWVSPTTGTGTSVFLVSLNRQRAIKVSVKPLHRGQQQQLEARFKGQA